jgi:hypothetical protein
MKPNVLSLCWLLMMLCGSALAQDPFPQSETPEAVAQQYVEAMRASDWNKGALLMHPNALKTVRGMVEPIVATAKTEKEKDQLKGLFGVSSQAELAQLSDAEVFAKFMGSVTNLIPNMNSMLNSSSMQIIGKVGETADVQHLVYRMSLKIELPGVTNESVPFTKLEVMTLRRFEKSWRLELNGDMEAMMKAMSLGLAKRAAEEPPQTAVPENPPPKPAAKKKRLIRKK